MVNPIFKLMNENISTDAVNNLVGTPSNNMSVKMPGTTAGPVGSGTTPSLSTPELMTDAISNRDAGALADTLAATQNYYGGEAGVRSGLRHAIGSSYLFQENPLLEKFGETFFPGTAINPMGIISSDKDLDLWYHPDGPQINKIKDNHTLFGIFSLEDIQTLTDKTNNKVGIEQLSGLSFEERYKKMTGLIKEQLEHFAETGTFKRGLPVWNTEGEGTFETKGIIKTPEDAKKQLKVIAKGEEDLIDDRRMGSLRNKGDLSDIEQLMEYSRGEHYAKNINEKNKLKERDIKLKEDISEFKKINAARLSETKEVGRGKVKVSTENAQRTNKKLERLEKTYDRNLNSLESLQKEINAKELKPLGDFWSTPTEPIARKVIEEQKFLESKTK